MVKIEILKFFLLFISLLILNTQLIVFSQEIKIASHEYIRTIISYASWWWFFFILGIAAIVLGIISRNYNTSLSKGFLYSGLIIVFGVIFMAQILYVLPLIPVIKGIDVYRCEGNIDLNFIQYIACLFSGLTPANNIYSFLVWTIFLFILPLAILVSLFWEFTTPFIIEHPNIRKVIAFASSLIAYRFLMSYLFVEFISFGLGGIALFLVNILLFGWAVNGIRRLFRFAEIVKMMREVQDLAQLERLLRMREDAYASWQAAMRSGNIQLAEQLSKQLDEIDKKIDKLRKSMEKRGEKITGIPAPS